MDIDVPGTAAAQQRVTTIEEDLAAVFAALLEDRGSAHDAVSEAYDVCLGRVTAARAKAAEQLGRQATRHMALNALAEEMEAQAATWKLLFYLYCDLTPPAGSGGIRLMNVGGASLYRQRLAGFVGKDPDLARCGRVVSWLESLADDAVERQGIVGFADGEGLWLETRTEMLARTDALVSELDPDAPGRTGRPLHPNNARSQERILARVWQLLRAGRMSEAQDACQRVGQPWRAAAIGGGGPVGLLPVGITAQDYDDNPRIDLQAEELADEVCNGAGTMAALWRWAANEAATAPPGDKFERAVFGALGGNTAAAAGACATWEDYAWVYCRSWLESQAMRAVQPAAQSTADLVAGDVVTAALARCGVAPAAAQRAVEGALSVAMGGGVAAAAAAALYDGGGDAAAAVAAATASSRGFGQLFVQHVMSPGALVGSGPAAVQALRLVQGLLVQGDMHALTEHLAATLVEQNRGLGFAGGAAADADEYGVVTAAAPTAAFRTTNAERPRRTCALAVHMLLALQGLGALPPSAGPQVTGPDMLEAHSILDGAQRLLAFYAGGLLEAEQLSLLPPYLCVLRPALRRNLCGELLAMYTRRLTGVGAVTGDGSAAADDAAALQSALAEADAECHGAIVSLDHWFRSCAKRQRKPQQERSSCLETDVREDELRYQLATFTFACRHNRGYGPHQRARIARWLALPHVIAAEAAAADAATAAAAAAAADEEDGGGDAAAAASAAATEEELIFAAASRLDPWSYHDVLDFANCLCCEFALGDDVTAAAGHRLFEEVLPEALEAAACASADLLLAAAAAADTNAAAGSAGPVYMFEEDQREAGAAGAARRAEEVAALAVALRERADELAGWRLYFGLDARLAGWTARREAHEAAAQRAAAMGDREEVEAVAVEAEALLQEGGGLLQDFLEELLRTGPGWQQELAAPRRALAAAASDGVLRVTLTVTCPPGSGAAALPGIGLGFGQLAGAGIWGQATAPYPELQGAALLEFREALDAAMRRAAAARGVAVEVAVEEGGGIAEQPQGRGHVTLSLAVAADDQLWRAVVELVCGVVRGEVEGMPPLLLVAMEADRATSLAVCRRCCIGQAVMRCAALRMSLVQLGADADSPEAGPQLVEMLDLSAAEGSSGLESGGLLELLSGAQLAGLLAIEGDTDQQQLRNLQVAWQRHTTR